MHKNYFISSLLLIGGTGARFKSSLPKQFHVVAGKKIYLHTLDAFIQTNLCDEIILVCHRDWIETVKSETSHIEKIKIKVVEGGLSRQESSFNGLSACSHKDIVLIHDAVRPFVTKEIILNNIEMAIQYGAVDTCIKSSDTLVQIKDDNTIEKIPDRSKFMRGQTPQTFQYDLIYQAHLLAQKSSNISNTDDCSLIYGLGKEVKIVEGSESNIKITNPQDIFLAEHLFRHKFSTLPPSDDSTTPLNSSLQNKTFAIIGGNGGIGSEVVKLLEMQKAKTIVLSKNSSNFLNLQDIESIKEAFSKIFAKHGEIDGLINCAGFLVVKDFKEHTPDEIDSLIDINLKGLVYSCKFAKLKQGAHIVNISSSSFSKGRKGYGIYSATKAAVVNFTQALSEEYPDLKINVIIPQRTNTKLRRDNFPDESSENLLDPKIVAINIVNLLKSENITGSLIVVRK
jgi:ribitol-5-phosphate 2-dehydrogenase (NADP+) / D-ribitol-5-phosphate cytidylyltransferase